MNHAGQQSDMNNVFIHQAEERGTGSMSEIVMYCTRFCPYCISAERLLNAKGVRFTKIAVDNDQDMWDKMQRLSNRNTVPQIFIGEYHVGGYDDLAALERGGRLDPLLEPFLSSVQG